METAKAKIEKLLNRGVEEVIEREHLAAALLSNMELRVKLGIDPTSPDLHLGHAVVLRKLKEFQDLGHKVVLIIGDFTGQIGDPSGRAEARKPLTEQEVKANMKQYLSQAGKVLDVAKAEIVHNSSWFKRDGVRKLLSLMKAGSIPQMLRREDFAERIKAGRDVTLLEALYSLLQGYDSVMVKADVEVGGADQKLNLLMGRKVQRYFGMSEQDVLTMPLLEGLDGKRKMSKSLGNYIGLDEKPNEMFGKVMSLPDALVSRYFLLCTDIGEKEIAKFKKTLSPRDFKARLGCEIVELYHGEAAAKKAETRFTSLFSKKEIPKDIPILRVSSALSVEEIVLKSGVAKSRSEARRLVLQGGVKINGVAETNPKKTLALKGGEVLRIGKKRFFRVK